MVAIGFPSQYQLHCIDKRLKNALFPVINDKLHHEDTFRCKKLLSALFEKHLAVEKLVVTKLVRVKNSSIDLTKQLSLCYAAFHC